MRKLIVLTVVVVTAASTVAHGESLLGRLRLRERSRLTERETSIREVGYVEAAPTPALPSLPTETVYEPIPQAGAPVVADPAMVAPGTIVQPAPIVGMPAPATFALWTNVKVRSPRNIHPCATPMIVTAPDPCNPCCQVCVEICAPPCAVAKVKCRKDGQRLVYDFGKYEVVLTARHDVVVVNYND